MCSLYTPTLTSPRPINSQFHNSSEFYCIINFAPPNPPCPPPPIFMYCLIPLAPLPPRQPDIPPDANIRYELELLDVQPPLNFETIAEDELLKLV